MPKPNLPLDISKVPPPPSDMVLAYLPILTKTISEPPFVSFEDPPEGAPNTPPRSNGFVTVVEWPLRPGDTRIEAYFIGTDKQRRYWFLWQFTMNDLVPFIPKYLEKRPIAEVPRQKLSKRDAAAVLLKTVWEYEKINYETSAFMMVSDSGCLETTAVYAIAENVWGK